MGRAAGRNVANSRATGDGEHSNEPPRILRRRKRECFVNPTGRSETVRRAVTANVRPSSKRLHICGAGMYRPSFIRAGDLK